MGNKHVKPIEVKEEHPPVTVNSGEIKGISAGVVNVQCINQEIIGGDDEKQKANQHFLDVRRSIQSVLISRYMNMTLPRCPWLKDLILPMDKYYVSLMLHQIPGSALCEPFGKYIALQELFQPIGNEIPYRVLVEGAPGYGKTTLALKIAFDWVKQAPYLMGFDLVFILFLRHFESSLEEMLAEAAATDEGDSQRILEAIKMDTSKVLLMLDGFDEMKEEFQPFIMPLLQRKKFPNMTVLLTSRTGKLPTLENIEQQNPLFSSEASSFVTDFWNRKVLIKGISDAQQDIFLKTYLSPEYNFDIIASRFKSTIGTRPKELLSCPLFLLLLAMLVIDSDLKQPQNKTQLYSAVFNFMIRKWLNRQNEKDEIVNITSISFENVPSYVQLLVQFGKFALKMLHEDKMSFAENEITSCCDERILSMGFLTKTTTIRRKRTVSYYEPLHKTLIEFIAAYHLWYMYNQKETEYFEKEIKSLKELSVQEMTASFLLPFLVGLLGDKAEDLFKLILPDDFQYSSYFYSIIGTLMECQMTDRLVQLIRPLIPHRWMISWFNNDEGFSVSPSHFTVLRYGLYTGKIKIIQWNLQCKTRLPCKLNIDRLVLLTKLPVNVDLLSCKEVKCVELLFHFAQPSDECNPDAITTLITNASVIDATRVSFDMKTSSSVYLPAIHQAMTGDCKKITIHRLSCTLNGKDTFLLTQLIEILNVNKVSILDLTLSAKKEGNAGDKSVPFTQKMLGNIINTLALESSEVKDMVLFNNQNIPLDINLTKLCNHGKKFWQRLWLTKIDFHIDKMKQMALVIEDMKLFDIKNIQSAFEALLVCRCKALTCGLEFLLQLCRNVPEQWFGFESVVELTVVVRESKLLQSSLHLLENFKNLEAVSLKVTKLRSTDVFIQEFLLLFQVLNHLRIIEILQAEENLKLLQYLVEGFIQLSESHIISELRNPSIQDRNIPDEDNLNRILLDTLKIQIDLSDNNHEAIRFDFFSLLTDTRRLLISGHLRQLVIVVPRNPAMRLEVASLIGSIFPREDNYTITHDLDGMNTDDTYNSRTYFDYNIIFERYSIAKRHLLT